MGPFRCASHSMLRFQEVNITFLMRIPAFLFFYLLNLFWGFLAPQKLLLCLRKLEGIIESFEDSSYVVPTVVLFEHPLPS